MLFKMPESKRGEEITLNLLGFFSCQIYELVAMEISAQLRCLTHCW